MVPSVDAKVEIKTLSTISKIHASFKFETGFKKLDIKSFLFFIFK
jgi:hypothetical protein